MKKILILCGSPRKNGNTNTVVEWVRQSAEAAGSVVKVVDTPRLQYEAMGCTSCMQCQRNDAYACVIPDEASPVLAKIPEYDVVVFATPLYFFGPSAQLKVFIDRMYSLFKFNQATGTITNKLRQVRFALIATGGGANFAPLTDMMQTMANFCGVSLEQLLIPHVVLQNTVQNDSVIKDKAIGFGRQLAQ